MPERSETKREAILAAAFTQFSRYGFRRTSMEDIAKETGISRASIYSHFENKEEVFRSLSASLHEQALGQAEIQLKGTESSAKKPIHVSARITFALLAKIEPFHTVLTQSEHGSELADENNHRCGDLVRESQKRFQTMLTRVLNAAARNGEIDLKSAKLTASTAAELIYLGATGLKQGASDSATLEKRIRNFVRVFLEGLT